MAPTRREIEIKYRTVLPGPMATMLFLVVKILHVISAVLWVGAAVFLNVIAIPSIMKAPPTAQGPILANLIPRATKFFIHVGLLTVITGYLAFFAFTGIDRVDFTAPYQMVMSIGGGMGVIMFLEGFFVVKPATEQLLKLGAKIAAGGGPPSPELKAEGDALRGKLMKASMITIILGITSLVIMVLGNSYVHA